MSTCCHSTMTLYPASLSRIFCFYKVIPNLELTEGSGDAAGKAHEIEPTHFFGLFDGYVWYAETRNHHRRGAA